MSPKPKFIITKKMLKDLHLIKEMTPNEIAKLFGCSHSLILYYLKKYKIKKLSKHERINGMKFGNLTVIKLQFIKNGNAVWECLCDCGKTVYVNTGQLKSGNVRLCGCAKKKINTTHGMSKTRQYIIWQGMKTRCTNSTQPNYERYGNRGISYVSKWETFEDFWKDMKLTYKDNLTLDRIDNNLGYTKSNCRWVSPSEQNRNKTNNIKIMYKNIEYCLSEFADLLNVNRNKLYYLHECGYSNDELIALFAQ